MPFQSEAQRRYMWMRHPKIAKKWAREHPESNKGLPMHKNTRSAAAKAIAKRYKK